ncbi:hypothetical protein VTK56DRAFT_5084 [Thermocarpiscus australiensis]
MGPPRDTPASQREYLINIASQVERAARDALDGRYEINDVFEQEPALKLITHIVKLNEGFAALMETKGHTRSFEGESPRKRKLVSKYEASAAELYGRISEYPELIDVLPADQLECPGPSENIMEHIAESYNENRGPELGTVSSVHDCDLVRSLG